MNVMVINKGEKIHIITRRQFEGDLRRHFAGIVEAVSDQLIRVRGFAFVFDETMNEFMRRDEERIRIFSASDAGLIINLLPAETVLEKTKYQMDEHRRRIFTDGKNVFFNVSEFSARR